MNIKNEINDHSDIMYSRTIKVLKANNLEELLISSERSTIQKSFILSIAGRFPNLKKLTFISPHVLPEHSFKVIVEKFPQITEFKYLTGGNFFSRKIIYCNNLKQNIISNIMEFMNSSDNLKFALLNYSFTKISRCDEKPGKFRLDLQDFCDKAEPPIDLSKICLLICSYIFLKTFFFTEIRRDGSTRLTFIIIKGDKTLEFSTGPWPTNKM